MKRWSVRRQAIKKRATEKRALVEQAIDERRLLVSVGMRCSGRYIIAA
jgi:hypothetical protein